MQEARNSSIEMRNKTAKGQTANPKRSAASRPVLASIILLACSTLYAEVYGKLPGKSRYNLSDSVHARFFATTDFGFVPGQPDPEQTSWGALRYTRGQATAKMAGGGSSAMPSRGRPWVSGVGDTVFGVTFRYPPTSKIYPDERPVMFERIIIHWGRLTPARGSLSGSILTEKGETLELPIDRNKAVYPFDLTTIRVKPTTIKKLSFELKGNTGPVEVQEIELLEQQRERLPVGLCIHQPEFYVIYFNRYSPERKPTNRAYEVQFCEPIIENIFPAHGSLGRKAPLSHPTRRGLVQKVRPFILHKGTRMYAEKEDYPVAASTENGVDRVSYTLKYDLTGAKKGPLELLDPVEEEPELDDLEDEDDEAKPLHALRVEMVCHPRVDDCIALSIEAAKPLPEGAQLGLEMQLGTKLSGLKGRRGSKLDLPLKNGAVTFESPLGHFGLKTSGLRSFEARVIQSDARFRPPLVAFTALAKAGELQVSFSLPVGPNARHAAEEFAWYDSAADGGEPGYAPFRSQDLELIEVINCGDPDDSHTCYDISNDPVIEEMEQELEKWTKAKAWKAAKRYRTMLRRLKKLDPAKDAAPIVTVAGQKCRALSNTFGAYMRYDLETTFERSGFYLLVVEHAFDQERRGTVYSFHPYFQGMNFLGGGLDTGQSGHDGKYRREAILFPFREGLYGGPDYADTGEYGRFSLCVSTVWRWRGWLQARGPAIRRIELYYVKQMPKLGNIQSLLPARTEQRFVGILTETPKPEVLNMYPGLVGYNLAWTYASPATTFLSGTSAYPPKGCGPQHPFQPGSLRFYEWLLQKAEERGLVVKTHLGQLLTMGYEDGDRDSFTGGSHRSYIGDYLPVCPTEDEKKTISAALGNSLSKLSRYDSLRDVCLSDLPYLRWNYRNLTDFCRETGVEMEVSVTDERNMYALLDDPALLAKWMDWSAKRCFRLHKWLLSEIRQYRGDLFITFNAAWYQDLMGRYSMWRKKIVDKGIGDFAAFMRFNGFDARLYKGIDGFAFQISGQPPVSSLRPMNKFFPPSDPRFWRTAVDYLKIPKYYDTPWFREFSSCFASGMNIDMKISYDESTKPFVRYTGVCFKNRTEFRQMLIEALLINARTVSLATYPFPWSGRIADFREFAVAFRLLPFTPPQAYEGQLLTDNPKVSIRKHGRRYALINASAEPAKVKLELPAGVDGIYDLSSGRRKKLKVDTEGERKYVEIEMRDWALRTLTRELDGGDKGRGE